MLIPLGFLGAGAVPNSFELIASLSTGQNTYASFNVAGLGSTYKHLQIRVAGRTIDSGVTWDGNLRFNLDTGNNYAFAVTRATYNTWDAAGTTSSQQITRILGRGSNANGGGIWGNSIIDIIDPFSTSKSKSVFGYWATINNYQNPYYVAHGHGAGTWRSAAAVTSIDLTGTYAWANGSRVSLYGIKG